MNKAKMLVAVAVLLGAGVAMAGEQLVPNRLAAAKVGEWALYQVPNNYTQKLTVTAREGEGAAAMVTVRIDDIYDGEVVTTREISQEAGEAMIPPQVPDEPEIAVTFDTGTFSIKGKTVDATVVKVAKDFEGEEDDENTEWWMSTDIPVFGVVKKITDGESVFEVIDFGDN